MMYFCTSSTTVRSAITFATSQNIEGPYTYKDTLVYSGFSKTSRTDSGSKIDTCYTNTNIKKLIDDGILKDGVNENWFSSLSGGFNNSYAPNAIDPTIAEGIVGDYFFINKAGTAKITATYKKFKVSCKVKVKAK